MKNKLVIFCLMCSLIVIHFSFPTAAFACSCAGPEPVKAAFERNSVIFSGKALLIHDPKNGRVNSSTDPLFVLFEVDSSWKGPTDSQIIVKTARESASCGFEFEEAQNYIVYAHTYDKELETSICDRTAVLAEAEEDLNVLGKGRNDLTTVSLEDTLIKKDKTAVYWGIGCIFLLATIVIFLKRKKFDRFE